MLIGARQIDHIVYSVPDLEEAIILFEKKLGIKPIVGGRHLSKGTHNALINLDNKCYLEILAIDQSNKSITAPRWMGIDYLQSPKITRWSLQSDEIELDSKTLKNYHSAMGNIIEGNRALPSGETLRWKMTEPLPAPEVDVVPFLIDWSESSLHPTQQLPHQCELVEIAFYHPQPNLVQSCFEKLFDGLEIQKRKTVGIEIILSGPKGLLEL